MFGTRAGSSATQEARATRPTCQQHWWQWEGALALQVLSAAAGDEQQTKGSPAILLNSGTCLNSPAQGQVKLFLALLFHTQVPIQEQTQNWQQCSARHTPANLTHVLEGLRESSNLLRNPGMETTDQV